jgi:hypothetical protein
MGEPYEATPPSAPLSYPEPQIVSPHITLQAPLSRRGKGPGLILVLDHYALIEKSEKHLDPPPLQKFAEEGFAVVQLLVPGKVEDGGEFPLQKVLEVLKGCDACEFEKGVGMICKCYVSASRLYTTSKLVKLRVCKSLDESTSQEARKSADYQPILTSIQHISHASPSTSKKQPTHLQKSKP